MIDRLAANAPLSLKAMKALTVRQLEFRDAITHDDVDARCGRRCRARTRRRA